MHSEQEGSQMNAQGSSEGDLQLYKQLQPLQPAHKPHLQTNHIPSCQVSAVWLFSEWNAFNQLFLQPSPVFLPLIKLKYLFFLKIFFFLKMFL